MDTTSPIPRQSMKMSKGQEYDAMIKETSSVEYIVKCSSSVVPCRETSSTRKGATFTCTMLSGY
jgi:hypothetical protein